LEAGDYGESLTRQADDEFRSAACTFAPRFDRAAVKSDQLTGDIKSEAEAGR
jgi:hypothetical protein